MTADRRVIYWNDFCADTCNAQVNARSLDPPSTGSNFGSRCDLAWDDEAALVNPAYPSPDPSTSGENLRVVYAGCRLNGTGTDNTLIHSTAGGEDGVQVVQDDEEPQDPSWSSDGLIIVAAEGGNDPGLWRYRSNGTVHQYLLAAPAGTLRGPRVMGANAGDVLFAANGSLWKVSASCDENPAAAVQCDFPDDAQKLADDADWPAWTSASAAQIPSRTVPAGGGTQGSGGGDGSGGQGSTNTTGTGASVFARAPRARGTRRGVVITMTLARRAGLAFTFSKTVRGGGGRSARTVRLGTVRRTGPAGSNRFTFTRVRGRRLRKGSYRVSIRAAGERARALSFRIR